jgi:hypothetical protein
MLLLRVASDVGERQNNHREAGGGFFGRWGWRGLRVAGRADVEHIDPDRFGEFLELGRAESGCREIEPRLHLAVGVFRQADRPGLRDAFQSRSDIDAVAHQVAVAFLDHVAEMDADPELDPPVGRQAGVTPEHAVLHLDRASHRIHDAAELGENAVPGAFEDAA